MNNPNKLKNGGEGFLDHDSVKGENLKCQNQRIECIEDKKHKEYNFCEVIGRINILEKINKGIHTGLAKSEITSATRAGCGTCSNSKLSIFPAVWMCTVPKLKRDVINPIWV